MARPAVSAAHCVLLLQALVARELVESMGLSGHRAARLLGIAPSAVSQYRSGKRRGGPLDELGARPDVQALARTLAQTLARDAADATPSVRPLLDAAASLYEELHGGAAAPGPEPGRVADRRELARQYRLRIAAEQTAVSDCMHLAQKSRDELTRALFRHIASDSLRHAEIAASLASHLDRGLDQTWASGITKADVERLIEREAAAEQPSTTYVNRSLGGVMALLAMSMEADERKHTELLKRLLRSSFVRGEDAGGPRGTTERSAVRPRRPVG